MRQVVTTGIVLKRINFGEADRIITIITPDNGKISLMAKGVRKVKSKLAGGIELFSISAITFLPGKRDIHTLISSRLVTHFGNIVANIDRTNAAYELLKQIDKSTDEKCEAEYFELLLEGLQNLNHETIEPSIIESWFMFRLLKVLGNEPNLKTDVKGQTLQEGKHYIFDFDRMAFDVNETGKYNQNHIKLLRLFLTQSPEKLSKISGVEKLNQSLKPLIKTMFSQFVNV